MIIDTLRQLQRSIFAYLDSRRTDGELTGHQLRTIGVMNRLRDEKGFVLQRDIEEILCINRSSVCSILKSIEEKGYIVKRSSEQDARANIIEFTEKTEKLNKTAIRQVSETEKILTEGMTASEKEMFEAFVRRSKENIDRKRGMTESV